MGEITRGVAKKENRAKRQKKPGETEKKTRRNGKKKKRTARRAFSATEYQRRAWQFTRNFSNNITYHLVNVGCAPRLSEYIKGRIIIMVPSSSTRGSSTLNPGTGHHIASRPAAIRRANRKLPLPEARAPSPLTRASSCFSFFYQNK